MGVYGGMIGSGVAETRWLSVKGFGIQVFLGIKPPNRMYMYREKL